MNISLKTSQVSIELTVSCLLKPVCTDTSLVLFQINMMMDSQDPVVLICDKHLLRMLDWPAHVPVADMETAFCNINWTEIASSMMSSYDQEPTLRKVSVINVMYVVTSPP